jgi:hypothetical protein
MTKSESIADTVRSGTRTSRILDKIRKERKNDVGVAFAPEGAKPLTDRKHTLDVRRECWKISLDTARKQPAFKRAAANMYRKPSLTGNTQGIEPHFQEDPWIVARQTMRTSEPGS